MSVGVDELRPLTAGRLLAIRREVRREAEDELEQALLCNARVLAECCYCREGPVFRDGDEVLGQMTCREMEALLSALAAGRGSAGAPVGASAASPASVNPHFDGQRFRRMREAGDELH